MYIPRRQDFDHIGLMTDVPQAGESFEAQQRVWLTNPRASEASIEWVRWEPDSPVTNRVRHEPHVAFRVADLDEALAGHTLIHGPLEVANGFCRYAFVELDGGIVEFMAYANPDEEGWFSEQNGS